MSAGAGEIVAAFTLHTAAVDAFAAEMTAVDTARVDNATAPTTPSMAIAALTGVLALLAVWIQPLWRLFGHFYTAVHEGGHALTAFLANRRVEAVRLETNQSGSTTTWGRPTGVGRFLTAFAGYLAPSLLGLASAGLLSTGNVTATFVFAGIALLSLLIQVENGFGAFVVLVALAALVIVVQHAAINVQVAVACGLTWFLLFSGVHALSSLRQVRKVAKGTDADTLGRLTHLPGGVWVVIFYAVNLYCLLFGGRLLLTG